MPCNPVCILYVQCNLYACCVVSCAFTVLTCALTTLVLQEDTIAEFVNGVCDLNESLAALDLKELKVGAI